MSTSVLIPLIESCLSLEYAWIPLLRNIPLALLMMSILISDFISKMEMVIHNL